MAVGFTQINSSNTGLKTTYLVDFQVMVLSRLHLGQYLMFLNESLLKFSQNGRTVFLANFRIDRISVIHFQKFET